jgi:hypothetical protein
MLVGMAVTASAATYSDTSGHWGEAAIDKWSGYGVLQGDGDGTFSPERAMTVEELATVLANAFGYSESYKGELPGYAGTWGESAVRRAVAAGALAAGEASSELTRELAAKIISKALGVTPTGGETKFSDDYAVSPKYKPYVNALGKLGVFNGDTRGRFMPDAGFKRAEVMQVFDNVLGDIIGQDKTVELERGALINKAGVTLKDSLIDGDLYIGQGVGDGDVTLEDVTVTGRLVVFGGGSGSIHIKGASVLPSVLVNKTFGQPARISVESAEATVGTVALAAGGKSAVETAEGALITKIELPAETAVDDEGEVITVKAAATEAKISAAAETVAISSEGAKVELASKAAIESLSIEGAGASVAVTSGATVKEATVSASGVSISGSGKVETATVTQEAESGVTIKTNGTAVTVDENAGAVTTGNGATIDPGKTANAKPDTSSGGGGGGGPSGSGHTYIDITSVKRVDGDSAQQGDYTVTKSNGIVTIGTDGLNLYQSATQGQGEHYWVGVLVTLNKPLTDVEFQNTDGGSWSALTAADITEAQQVGAEADDTNTFVYWIKYEDVGGATPIFISVREKGYDTTIRKLTFVNQYSVEAQLNYPLSQNETVDQSTGRGLINNSDINTALGLSGNSAVTIAQSNTGLDLGEGAFSRFFQIKKAGTALAFNTDFDEVNISKIGEDKLASPSKQIGDGSTTPGSGDYGCISSDGTWMRFGTTFADKVDNFWYLRAGRDSYQAQYAIKKNGKFVATVTDTIDPDISIAAPTLSGTQSVTSVPEGGTLNVPANSKAQLNAANTTIEGNIIVENGGAIEVIDNATIKGSIVVESGATATVIASKTLTVAADATLTAEGTLTVENGGTLAVAGKVTVNGILTVAQGGTITGSNNANAALVVGAGATLDVGTDAAKIATMYAGIETVAPTNDGNYLQYSKQDGNSLQFAVGAIIKRNSDTAVNHGIPDGWLWVEQSGSTGTYVLTKTAP